MKLDSKILYKYFLIVSFWGIIVLVLLVFKSPPETVVWQKHLIFSLFLLICILGLIAGIYPTKCFKALQFKQNRGSYKTKNENKGHIQFKGHHPPCENFKGHTFNVKGKTYCAGCSGLVMGATISIVFTIIYLIYTSLTDYAFIIFLTGIITVFMALFMPLFINFKKNIHKFFLNVFFVLGAFLGLIGIDSINPNLAIQLYFMVLILIWIVTRILVSRENHRKICDECPLESCEI